MLPTRHGILFSFVLLAMLLIAVNYDNSLAYLMTFTLAATVLLSMIYTHRNLQGLCLEYGSCKPVFAGGILNFSILMTNATKRDRFDIGIDIEGDQSHRNDFLANEVLNIECHSKVEKRGWNQLPVVQVNTRYPLGLLFSWSKSTLLDRKALVYPRPAKWQEFPVSVSGNSTKPLAKKTSHDDYSGLRRFREGDPPQHIDWKAYARGKGLYCKEFVGGELPEMSFHWDDVQGDKEYKISMLTRWVIEASAQGIKYSLEMPGITISSGSGDRHANKCLKVLALF